LFKNSLLKTKGGYPKPKRALRRKINLRYVEIKKISLPFEQGDRKNLELWN